LADCGHARTHGVTLRPGDRRRDRPHPPLAEFWKLVRKSHGWSLGLAADDGVIDDPTLPSWEKRPGNSAATRADRHGRFVWDGSPDDRGVPLVPFANFGPVCVERHPEVCTRRAGHPEDAPAGLA